MRAQIRLPVCWFVSASMTAHMEYHGHGEHLFRRSGHIVQHRPLRSLRWADILQSFAWDALCPAAWLQHWLHSHGVLALILDRLLFRRSGSPVGVIRGKRGGMLSYVNGRDLSSTLLSPLLSTIRAAGIEPDHQRGTGDGSRPMKPLSSRLHRPTVTVIDPFCRG